MLKFCRRHLVAKAASPNDNDVPVHEFQQPLIFEVATLISFDFCSPPFRSRLWHLTAGATLMSMPEATVDEDHGLVFGQDNVGFAGQRSVFRAVHREPIA